MFKAQLNILPPAGQARRSIIYYDAILFKTGKNRGGLWPPIARISKGYGMKRLQAPGPCDKYEKDHII